MPMLTHEATRSEIEEWKRIFEEYRGKIRPCRRSGEELAAYLKKRYSAVRTDDREMLAATAGNVLENECYREKLPEGKEPRAEVFRLFWRGGEVFVELEAETGAFFMESSVLSPDEYADLYDEVFFFRGLDEKDLENFFLVAEYVRAAEKYGLQAPSERN